MDGRKDNGGSRQGAGRKPKAEEQQLIEKLTPMNKDALKALRDAVKDGESWAVKLYFEYFYGKPKQTLALEGGDKPIEISFED